MHEPKPKKDKDKEPIKIKVDKTPLGHQPHVSGTGVHGDKRLKRQKTRQNKNREAMKDYDEQD